MLCYLRVNNLLEYKNAINYSFKTIYYLHIMYGFKKLLRTCKAHHVCMSQVHIALCELCCVALRNTKS